jgi:transcription antitermination factor NusG
LELNDFIDNINYQDIENALLNTFGENIDYFIPIYHEEIGSYTSTSTLMDGYVFLKFEPCIQEKMINFRDQRIFSKILCKKGKYSTLNSRVIAGLKNKLKNTLKKRFAPGAKVKILDGVFKNLVGEVIGIEDQGRKIVVKIKRISREIIAPIPATLLEKIKDDQPACR